MEKLDLVVVDMVVGLPVIPPRAGVVASLRLGVARLLQLGRSL